MIIKVTRRVRTHSLAGPDVFLEETIHQCLAVFLDDYIIVQAQQGRLQFPLEVPIAGLDALLPFYEDLVRRFEEWSYGDLLYSKTLLIPCYLNINLASATFLRMTLWSQENSSIVRQILLREHDLKLARSAPEEMKFQEEQNYENYSKLLVLYAAAIMNETVVRERNPLMFKIAAEAVGQFVDRHKNAPVSDFTQMASMLVKAVRSKIPI
uniref:RPAP1/MINIYO-like TPR repeats domain-containing protein n=1 Tax=Plectus sambesii TaxID=2011161 RepID=A0A914WMD1_9BILA